MASNSEQITEGNHDSSIYLCLRCRQVGHIFNECPNDWFLEIWITSQRRKELDFGDFPTLLNQPLCKRCQDLDILNFLSQELPWNSMLFLEDRTVRDSGCLRNIGKVGTIVFRQDCSLCRCLYTLTPEPETENDEVVLFPSWTMCRLEGGIAIDNLEKAKYARSLHVVLDSPPFSRLADIAQRQDALCLLEEDRIDPESTLGAKVINSQQMDFDAINKWLSLCGEHHPVTCVMLWHEQLRSISLIDVRSRHIVRHPGQGCSYLALSYVWGGVDQGSRYELGVTLRPLPQTIEDAITFTLKLGKQYLWVDSVCIDQGDKIEKRRQISMMNLIYEGADATIIAFSSTSADSGLPRLSLQKAMTPQMKTSINGKRLVGLGPTLSQSVWISSWGNRAWTMQEALLSRRCIYLSTDQVLFECNGMQCSEALDESRSWVHHTFRDESFFQNQTEALIGAGVLHSPFVAAQKTDLRLQHYTVLANLYSYRELTFDEDAINGFSGIIQSITRLDYCEGFFWGLPKEDLNWALGWNVQWWGSRRPQFPSWAWAGWKHRLMELQPINVKRPHQFPIYFKVWRLVDGRLVPILSLPKKNETEVEKIPENSFLQKIIEKPEQPLNFEFTTLSQMERDHGLFIEGITWIFEPDYDQPRNTPTRYGEFYYFDMEISGIHLLMRVIFGDAILESEKLKKALRCLVIAIDRGNLDNFYYMLVLQGNGTLVERQSMITVQTSREDNDLLDCVDVKRERIVLK